MLKEVCKSMVALALLVFSPFCLVGCGDDDDNIKEGIQGGGGNDDDTGNNTYQIGDLVGTWEIVHSQYTRRENGVVVDSGSEDVSDDHNRFVFYSDGRVEFLEYSDTQGTWHEDGKGTFYLRNGKIVFMGDFKDVSILSLSKTKLVLKYKFVEDKGVTIVETEYIDTMERIDDNSGNVNGTYTMSDLVGTWEIVHSQYTYKENGVVVQSGSEDVSDEHNRFVFYSNGTFEFLEYSDSQGTWHEDGKGTFYLRNGQFVFEGDMKDASILSLTKTKLVAKYRFVEDKGGTIYEDEYIDTMERIAD